MAKRTETKQQAVLRHVRQQVLRQNSACLHECGQAVGDAALHALAGGGQYFQQGAHNGPDLQARGEWCAAGQQRKWNALAGGGHGWVVST